MSMTREEAIKSLQNIIEYWTYKPTEVEAAKMAISALRPITREQVDKVWRGCSWCNNEGKKPENWECFILDNQGFSVVVGDEVVWTNAEFCPVCGKPLTAEAVNMVIERLEEVQNDQ